MGGGCILLMNLQMYIHEKISFWVTLCCFPVLDDSRAKSICLGVVLRGDANGKLTCLKCKPMFNYCSLQFQTLSISHQITLGNFLLGSLTRLSIQLAELFVQGLDFDETLIIGIT